MIKLEFLKGTHTESQPLESDLSFEEICPIWSQKLKNGIDEIDRTCIRYGQKFSRAAKDNKSCDNFESLISDFSRHWNQRHKKVRRTRLLSVANR